MFDTCEDDREYDPSNDEEASFHFMLMDFEHWVKKDGFEIVYKELGDPTKLILTKFYANKLRCEGS